MKKEVKNEKKKNKTKQDENKGFKISEMETVEALQGTKPLFLLGSGAPLRCLFS